MIRKSLLPLSCFALLTLAGICQAEEGKWKPLFNGKNLDGWTVKIRGHEAGDNFNDTFRVEDGLMTVSYDKWDTFNERFGHIFYKDAFSHYRLRVEYRFIGEQCDGGPGWAYRNSGAMLHCQSVESMTKDQDFPVSIETQILGGNGKADRPTGNLCTPGTNVEMNGKLFKPHCKSSTSKTYHGDQWVTLEVEVRGDEVVRHFINGEKVFEYQKPQLDERDANAKKLIDARGGEKALTKGFISLQAESHPCQFRKVEIMVLDE